MRNRIKTILREELLKEGMTKADMPYDDVPMGVEFGYHGGTLKGKTDTVSSGHGSDRMPLTGYYFFSDPERAATRVDGGPFYAVDFSKYNLWRPPSSAGIFCAFKTIYKPLMNALDEYEEEGKEIGEEEVEKIKHELYINSESFCEALSDKVRDNLKEVIDVIKNNRGDPEDTNYTKIFKTLGYEGVDTRLVDVLPGDADTDNDAFGSVIFDLKPETVYGPFYVNTYKDEDEGETESYLVKVETDVGNFKKLYKVNIPEDLSEEEIEKRIRSSNKLKSVLKKMYDIEEPRHFIKDIFAIPKRKVIIIEPFKSYRTDQ